MTTGSRWPVVAAFALVAGSTQLLWLNFAGVTTVAADHYGVSETSIGWLAQVFPLLYVALAIPAGIVLDRWFRGGLLAGAVLTALGALVRLGSDAFVWVLVGQLLVAVAQPLVLNAITGVASRYLAEKDRPTGIAVGTASTFAGMLLAFVLTFAFSGADDLRALLVLSAAIAGAAAVLLGLALRAAPPPHAASVAVRGSVATAWADPFLRRLCLLVTLPFGTFVALTTFTQPLLAPAGVSVDTANLLLMANVVAGVLGCAVVPVLAARLGREVAVMLTGLAATAAGCAALALAPGALTGFVALVAVGIALVPALPVVLDLVERRTGEGEDGVSAGLVWMAGNLGGLVIAGVVGVLVDHPSPAFLVSAAAAALGIPVALSLRPFVNGLRPGPTTPSPPAGARR